VLELGDLNSRRGKVGGMNQRGRPVLGITQHSEWGQRSRQFDWNQSSLDTTQPGAHHVTASSNANGRPRRLDELSDLAGNAGSSACLISECNLLMSNPCDRGDRAWSEWLGVVSVGCGSSRRGRASFVYYVIKLMTVGVLYRQMP
jgi:hypothetical protein